MVYIIAEIGSNHNGDIELAKEMVRAAAATGVDAVKFQTFKANLLLAASAPKAAYQKKETGDDESQLEMIRKLEFSFEDYLTVKEFGESLGLDVFSTAFDEKSLAFLISTGMEIYKIPSGEITNLPYLREIAKQNKKIIISTGMAVLEEIHAACQVLVDGNATDITVLHCTTDYPTKDEDVNLNNINTLMKEFPSFNIGFSDHSIGSASAIAAAALGVSVIEKHFTTDQTLPGPDQKASATPKIMTELVKGVRTIEKSMGKFTISPTPIELENRIVARKSIVARRPIEKGEVFSENNLISKRPGSGISPMKWDSIIGKKALKAYEADDLIDQNELGI